MKRYYVYSLLLLGLVTVGCSSDSFEDYPRLSSETPTNTDPISTDVRRFTNGGVGLSDIPNSGAYVVTFASPTEKEEMHGAPHKLFSGSVSSSRGLPASEFALPTMENEPQDPDEFESLLFSPADRLRLMEDATDGVAAPMTLRALTGEKRNVFLLGDTWNGITVIDWQTNQYMRINAECVGITDGAYFMRDLASPELHPALLQDYMEKFEASHRTVRTNFASESDIDGNGKVIVIFYDMNSRSMLGYFNPVDKMSAANSNSADVFYINTAHATDETKTELINFTLAHEFQHMVFFDNKYIEQIGYNASTWLDEGLSMLAAYLCGFYHDGNDSYIKNFLAKYSTLSLTAWTSANYGYSMLFAVYLYERFGIEAIKRIYKTRLLGWQAVEMITGMDFNLLFSDFAVALAISGRGYTNDPIYNFSGIDFNKYSPDTKFNLKAVATAVPVGMSYGVKVYPYGLSLREISGSASNIFMSGAPAGFVIVKK